MTKLQRLQNRASNVILQSPYAVETGDEGTKMADNQGANIYVHDCIHTYVGLQMHKWYGNNLVQNVIYGYNTRGATKHNLNTPKCNLSAGQRPFVFRGPYLWNNLSNDIRMSSILPFFKTRIIVSILTTR